VAGCRAVGGFCGAAWRHSLSSARTFCGCHFNCLCPPTAPSGCLFSHIYIHGRVCVIFINFTSFLPFCQRRWLRPILVYGLATRSALFPCFSLAFPLIFPCLPWLSSFSRWLSVCGFWVGRKTTQEKGSGKCPPGNKWKSVLGAKEKGSEKAGDREKCERNGSWENNNNEAPYKHTVQHFGQQIVKCRHSGLLANGGRKPKWRPCGCYNADRTTQI